MIDPRFYEALGPVTVRALSPSGDIGGNAEHRLLSAAPADRAGPDDLCYYEGKKAAVLTSAPGACIISHAQAHLAPKAAALIFSDRPRSLFARLAPALVRPRAFSVDGPAIDPSAKLEDGVRLGPRRCHWRGRADWRRDGDRPEQRDRTRGRDWTRLPHRPACLGRLRADRR
jgi:hypothetical protein